VTSSKRPTFWIVAGPNGSGKSSLYGNSEIEAFDQSVWIINPDLLTARIQDVEGLSLERANLEAVVRIEAWLKASIHAHQTVGVETVLSTDKYRRLVIEAKRRAFEFRLIFAMLASPDLNVKRVRIRVLEGGHDVPEEKIRERWGKSIRQLPWFPDQADQAAIFDNSGTAPRLIGRKDKGGVIIASESPSALREALDLSLRAEGK
jgi:predicted ABC-type ATPase